MTDQVDEEICYRHTDRTAFVRCQRCDRRICGDCMHQASVGFHCPECLKTGKQKIYRGAAAYTSRPIITQVLIAINALVFVIGVVLEPRALQQAAGQVARDFSLFGPAVDPGVTDGGEVWRLVTSAFLHGSLWHLGMNMFLLWLLGQQLERDLGRVSYVALYVAGLAGGSFGALLVSPRALTVGASGAIFGLLGAAAVLQKSRNISLMESGLGLLIGINVLLTFARPQISIGGHLGGLVAGAIAGWVLIEIGPKLPNKHVATAVVGIIAAGFFGAGIWAATTWPNPLFG